MEHFYSLTQSHSGQQLGLQTEILSMSHGAHALDQYGWHP